MGGGGFTMEPVGGALDELVLGLASRPVPRICFLPTASGDPNEQIARFHAAFADRPCEPVHLSLFRLGQHPVDLRTYLLEQDVIYVGGGNVVSLLGTWRAHGLDEVLAEAWRRGVVLCGPSAGSLCWFAEALTAFHGKPRRVQGLGLLPYSNCVHYDAEPERRAEYHRFVGDGMCAGYAADDGAALHFRGTELAGVVASRPHARAFRVEPGAEVELPVRYLGAPRLVAV
jgi:dipeptidase E